MQTVSMAIMTNKGAVREENQDAVFTPGIVRTGDMAAPEIYGYDLKDRAVLAAVIDGMGGHEGGALAARIIADTLSEAANNKEVFGAAMNIDADEQALRGLLAEAARRMKVEAGKNPLLAGMGAAVSGLLLREKSALAFNCGDCRVYRIAAGVLERVTRDHSVVQELFEAEEIDEDAMRTHPRKNIVTSAVCADYGDAFDLYVKGLSLFDGDAFFLCSDGVWEALSNRELAGLLERGAASDVFSALMAANCGDNISFIWIK